MNLLLIFLLLAPQPASETITVTATRTETRISDTPSSVVVLSRQTLQTTAAATTDDALRQVPGFTLFRRSGSRTANPTTQGLSLRGIGASGASRALVIDDGIPLNDPFGGWIYWGRVPRSAIARVEVLRGGASDLYGSAAMSGVVQFIRRRDDAVSAEISGGSQSTYAGSLFAAVKRLRLSVDYFDTAGYVLVRRPERGAVDRPADSTHLTADLSYQADRFFLRASHYDESRNNGTPMQTNETTIRQLAAGGNSGSFAGRAWFSDQDYQQTFSAIAADRNSERLTVSQRVPSRSLGTNAQWARPIAARHALLAGAEARQVSGTSEDNETRVFGRQRTVSAFVEDVFAATSSLSVTAGVRFDGWRDFNAWSPRLAVLYRAPNDVAFTASAYRAFRAPTLNELHRAFRVGNILTLANESLGPERLGAIELGVRNRNLRATFFWMEMDDVIANVTLSTTPALITRQRQNVASSRSRGLEIEGDWRVATNWRFSTGYLLTDAAVSNGKRVPQVPRNQLTAQVLYSSRFNAGVQARWSGLSFDDDLNQLLLRSYFVVDLFASHPIAERLDLTVAGENLFNRDVEVSATPVVTLGAPRSIRVGLRYGR